MTKFFVCVFILSLFICRTRQKEKAVLCDFQKTKGRYYSFIDNIIVSLNGRGNRKWVLSLGRLLFNSLHTFHCLSLYILSVAPFLVPIVIMSQSYKRRLPPHSRGRMLHLRFCWNSFLSLVVDKLDRYTFCHHSYAPSRQPASARNPLWTLWATNQNVAVNVPRKNLKSGETVV